MKQVVLAVSMLLVSAYASADKAGHEMLKQAIGSVLADTLSDTTEVTDRLGFVHCVYADTGGLWYHTNETGPEGTSAIRIAETQVSSPACYLTYDRSFGWTLVVVWPEETERIPAVRCRRRALVQPFWVWSECRDVTPHRRGTQ